MQLWGFREVSWSLQPCGRWELTISIKNESQSNCWDVLQMCRYSFSCVVILDVKMIILNISFHGIPSDQTFCERTGTLSLCRSVQWLVSVSSLCCWVSFDAEVLKWVLPSLASLELVCLARGSSGLQCLRQGWFALLNPFTLPAETTRFYSRIWLCGCSFFSGK